VEIKLFYIFVSWTITCLFKWQALNPILDKIEQSSLVFGFLPNEYFDSLSLFYGFLGNAVYSMIMIFRTMSGLSEGITSTKPFNKYTWILIITRPFGAAAFAFILIAILKGFGFEYFQDKGVLVMMGLLLGLFYEYIITKTFFDLVFDKLKDKIK